MYENVSGAVCCVQPVSAAQNSVAALIPCWCCAIRSPPGRGHGGREGATVGRPLYRVSALREVIECQIYFKW